MRFRLSKKLFLTLFLALILILTTSSSASAATYSFDPSLDTVLRKIVQGIPGDTCEEMSNLLSSTSATSETPGIWNLGSQCLPGPMNTFVRVWRHYLSFDSSSIPDGANVTSAKLCAAIDNTTLCGGSCFITACRDEINFQVWSGSWGSPSWGSGSSYEGIIFTEDSGWPCYANQGFVSNISPSTVNKYGQTQFRFNLDDETFCWADQQDKCNFVEVVGGLKLLVGTDGSHPGYCPGEEPVNQAPNTPTLVAPPHNTWINYNPNFQATVSDPDGGNVRAYFSSPASRWGSWVSSGGTSSTGSIGVSDTSGTSWRAYAQDPDGATSSWSGYWTLRKDTVNPSRTLDQENGTSTDTSIWVNLSESDDRSGVATSDVDVRINSGSWQNYSSTTSNFTYTGSDGNTYEFRYRVQDNAGNWSSFDYDGSVTIQLTNPPNTPTLVAPPHNTWINYNPTFRATVSDPDGGSVRAYFSAPADNWGSWVASGNNSSYGPVTIVCANGTLWRAYAQDPDGATSSWSGWWTLRVDTEDPSATLDQENGTSTDTSIWVNLTESDTCSGVAVGDVDVRINSGSWTHYSNTTSNFTYTGSDGNTYEFRYRVQDNAGNWSSFDDDGSVTIQLPPPTGTISGYVWEDDDEVCPVGGSKYANQTNAVTISPGPVSADTDANGYYEFTSVPYDTYQITANKPAGWSCACAGGTSDSCTKTVVVDASTPNPTVDFSIIHISAGWFQVIDGDIHAEQDIDNPVP